jgi:glycosyltransferase involved in cell wall biosynthesis
MSEPVDLLLITWNRLGYARKMMAQLLADPARFRVWWWDNGSTDGTREWISALDDPRLVERHLNATNEGQGEPVRWFLERAPSDVVGKIDDDILLPHGWTERIAPMIREQFCFGLLGCWIFMPEDWDESLAARNIVQVASHRVLRCIGIQGQSFLTRAQYFRKYWHAGPLGLPLSQDRMTLDGLINGYPVPPSFAHNMDDPRSPHWMSGDGKPGSLTARNFAFASAAEYAAWIAADAHFRQSRSFRSQYRWLVLDHDRSLRGRIKRKLLRRWRPSIDARRPR